MPVIKKYMEGLDAEGLSIVPKRKGGVKIVTEDYESVVEVSINRKKAIKLRDFLIKHLNNAEIANE